jgi:heme oxygenase
MTRVHGGGDGDPGEAQQRGLADLLRERTRAAHTQAERSGIVQDLLRGQATRGGYALYLRNLLPAYAALERAIEHRRADPAIAPLAIPAVYRMQAIEADLTALHGPGWQRALPLLPEGAAYADRIARVAQEEPARLIAHAYTRYLGDLNGGQVLKALLARTLGLGPAALAFHEFPSAGDLAALRLDLRAAIDRAGREAADLAAVVEEGERAFGCNISVSIAVRDAAPAVAH